MPAKIATIKVDKARKLTKLENVTLTFRELVNPENVLIKAVTLVDNEEHMKYYTGRKQVWSHIKHTQKELLMVVNDAIDKYLVLFASFSEGKEKYRRLLTAWYEHVGSWAVVLMTARNKCTRILLMDTLMSSQDRIEIL